MKTTVTYPKTIDFVLKHDEEMTYLSDVSYTLPRNLKEVMDKNVEAIVNSSYNTKPMHTGPYKITNWVQKGYMEFVPDPNYFLGPGLFDKVVFAFRSAESGLADSRHAVTAPGRTKRSGDSGCAELFALADLGAGGRDDRVRGGDAAADEEHAAFTGAEGDAREVRAAIDEDDDLVLRSRAKRARRQLEDVGLAARRDRRAHERGPRASALGRGDDARRA